MTKEKFEEHTNELASNVVDSLKEGQETLNIMENFNTGGWYFKRFIDIAVFIRVLLNVYIVENYILYRVFEASSLTGDTILEIINVDIIVAKNNIQF